LTPQPAANLEQATHYSRVLRFVGVISPEEYITGNPLRS